MEALKRALLDIDRRYIGDCLGINIRALLYTGSWLLEPGEKYILLRTVRILKYLAYFGCVCASIVFSCGIVARWGNYEKVAESVAVLIVVETAMIKNYMALYEMEGLVELARILDTLAAKCLDDANERRIFYRFKKASVFLTIWYGLFCVLAGFSYGIMPFFREGRHLPADFWCAFECKHTPVFEILYILAWLCCISLGIINGLIDTLCMSMLIYTIGQFRILRYRMEHSRQYALKKVALNKARRKTTFNRNLSLMYNLEIVRKTDISDSYIKNNLQKETLASRFESRFMSTTCQHVVERGRQKRGIRECGSVGYNVVARNGTVVQRELSKTEEFHQEMNRHLIECIENHQMLFRFTAKLQRQFGLMFFSELLFASMIICTLLFLMATYTSDKGKMVEWGSILIVAIIQLFAFCWFSSELTHQSTLLSDSLYCSDWLRSSREFKGMMRIIMSRALQPVQLTAAGYLPFSVVQFHSVMHSAYSCFATLTEFNAKR